MRMSCNGCRVLRKGCSENCSIRPCLQWIKSPQSQANATVFLAKFYGRAGLINLLNAGPDHLRPAIFRSLLYEACGRIVNPIYGSVGLLSTGTWHLCQAAVEAVLLGAPITPVASDAAAASQGPPLKVYDIRHVPSRDSGNNTAGEHQPRRVRSRKRGGAVDKRTVGAGAAESVLGGGVESTSRESSLTHMSHEAAEESESVMSGEGSGGAEPETSEAAKVEPSDGELELELTLGLEPVWGRGGGNQDPRPIKKRRDEVVGKGAGWCDSDWVGPSGNMGLGSWLCEPRACE